ncbi:FLVCR [Mytilus coruscus]|uniref:FLVCR n=1 Tax=Mytilus coruscus TaxID=42192 RepID=A0A6J8B7W0_MYTCO|nr:FLVCR [Mytilus coruscus]
MDCQEEPTSKVTEDKTSKVTEDKTSKVTEDSILPQVYRRRWIILFLFSFVSLTNNFQWLHLNIIGDVLLNYYNTSLPEDKFQQETALDWLSMIGAAVGFLLPPLLVKYSPDIDLVSSRLYNLFYIGAGITTVLFLLVLVIFKKEPPQPPSRAQWLAVRNATSQHYGKSLLRLLKNRGFLLLVLTYGINTGSYYAIATLLNPVVLHYYPGHQKEAGEIGLTVVIAGIGGAILAGVWLDKTKTFKFFTTGYLPVGFEIAAEITYPESEGTSSGLLNASAQLFGIIFTISMRAMMNEVSIVGANITLSSFLLLGTILTNSIQSGALDIGYDGPSQNGDSKQPMKKKKTAEDVHQIQYAVLEKQLEKHTLQIKLLEKLILKYENDDTLAILSVFEQ